ncbi:MAG: single-stranded DNA-binding protein [Elainellaceae cyanobacterium]
MASAGLNKWIVSGNLAADAEVKTVDLRSGDRAQVATATLYVQKLRDRKDSFTVSLNIWESSAAWRKLSFMTKGSLIICTGSVEPQPYISNGDGKPKAGLSMTVLDIDLDVIRGLESSSDSETSAAEGEVALAS